MERLKYFDQYVQEGLDATVTTDTDKDDEVKISLPGDANETTFIRKNRVIYRKDGKKLIQFPKDDPNYEYVDKIFTSIIFAQNQDKRNQVNRISGNDETIKNKVETLYDKDFGTNHKTIRRDIDDEISKKLEDIDICGYINLENILTKAQRQTFKWNTEHGKRIGKGEYLLPVLFPDIRKKHPSLEKGDDAITKDNGESVDIDLEVKAKGCHIDFIDIKDYPEVIYSDTNSDEEKIRAKYLYKCIYSIAYYLIGRDFDGEPCYLVLFDDNGDTDGNGVTDFNGIYVIKCDVPTKSLEKKTDDADVHDFALKLYQSNNVEIYGYASVDDDKKNPFISLRCTPEKIYCVLPKSYFKTYFSNDYQNRINLKSEGRLSDSQVEKIKSELKSDNNYKQISDIQFWRVLYIYWKYSTDKFTLKRADIENILDENIYNYISKVEKLIKSVSDNLNPTSDDVFSGMTPSQKKAIWVYELVHNLEDDQKILPDNIRKKVIKEKNNIKDISDEDIETLGTKMKKGSQEILNAIKDITKNGLLTIKDITSKLNNYKPEYKNIKKDTVKYYCNTYPNIIKYLKARNLDLSKNIDELNNISKELLSDDKYLSITKIGKKIYYICFKYQELHLNQFDISYIINNHYDKDNKIWEQATEENKITFDPALLSQVKGFLKKGYYINDTKTKQLQDVYKIIYGEEYKIPENSSHHVLFYGELFED